MINNNYLTIEYMENNNDLIEKPLPGLIRMIALPASIGFFFNTMYNVVDTYYAGLVSTQALAALSLSFPVFFVIIALGSGIATGSAALIANSLGSGQRAEAQKYATQAVAFSVFVGVILTICGLLSAPYLLRILGASGDYLAIAYQYLKIILLGGVFFMLNFVINSALNAQGDTRTFRNVLIAGFLLNLALDPWFIYGGFGLPRLGVAGVAWATFLIELLSAFYMGYRATKTGILCRDCLKFLRPDIKYFREIARQGFPASLNMMTVAIGIFIITYFVAPYGQEAVAAYGVATRIDQIALLPTIGLNIAVLTLVGQNNGARRHRRAEEAYRLGMKYGFWIVVVGAGLVFLFPRWVLLPFSRDPAVIDIGRVYLRISSLMYFAYMMMYISVSALQGLKRPMYAVWIGLYRQIALPALLFPLLAVSLGWGILGVWWGIFMVNWSGALFTVWYVRRRFGQMRPAESSS